MFSLYTCTVLYVLTTHYVNTLNLQFRDWKTFFLSPWCHTNEVHLFSNMTTLLWTGVELETSMGTAWPVTGCHTALVQRLLVPCW